MYHSSNPSNDSHISLIKSDFHYRNDIQLHWAWEESLFELRKENTQKIHSLSDKVIGLFWNKLDINTPTEMSIKIIEKLVDKIK